jgi:RNA 3'-terminal phosphate cyclase (ATP)
MIHIDASQGEGGGQVLRTSLALSMVTGQPILLDRIRARRPKPGLMRQHLTCVSAAQAISGAQVEGATPGSQTLRFTPGPVHGGEHQFSVGTAGSVMLVLQTVWPALLLADAPARLTLQGGTHNPMAPSFHFVERAYAPLVRRLGVKAELRLRRCGFYPGGGGEIEAELHPAGVDGLQPFDLTERGVLLDEHAECLIPGLKRSIAERELEVLREQLGWAFDHSAIPVTRQNEGPGNALLATLRHEHVTEVFCSLGEKTRSAEAVAKDVARQVKHYLGTTAALGPYLTDQWVLPLALAVWRSGRSARYTSTDVSLHAATNFRTIEQFLPVRIETHALPERQGVQVTIEPKGDNAA